jgi:hypothetical protein
LREHPRFLGLSARFRLVSSLQKTATLARISRKSPAKFPDIPVLRRLLAETNFELHWFVGAAVGLRCLRRPKIVGLPPHFHFGAIVPARGHRFNGLRGSTDKNSLKQPIRADRGGGE